MYYIGIDIGSTASKTAVLGDKKLHFCLPTGWSGKETSRIIQNKLSEMGIEVNSPNSKVIATGYGRVSVDYADRVVTEITCHGKGGLYLAGSDCTIIDVGGQDTKIITVQNGKVSNFLMNDKCSAGTGKFIEIMANRLGVTINELFELAEQGEILPISSLCTVFAETEIISYIGQGSPRENIASGIIDSVVTKVSLLCTRHGITDKILLTGGLSDNAYFAKSLSEKLKSNVFTHPMGRYAGALGAALIALS